MPFNQNLPVILSLPPGYCFSTFQQLAIDLSTGAVAIIPGTVGFGFNYGTAIPSVDNQDKPWIRLNPDNSLKAIYTFAFGTWTTPHPIPPGPTDFRAIWTGPLIDLYNYDGGDGTDPTVTSPGPTTGSFWEQDTAFAARTIVGVGTLPLSGRILAVGDLNGVDLVSLDVKEMPPHTHTPVAEDQAGKPANKIWGSSGNGTSAGQVYPSNNHGLAQVGTAETPINTTLALAGGDPAVTPLAVKAHENMPPFVTVYVIRRTARLHYTI